MNKESLIALLIIATTILFIYGINTVSQLSEQLGACDEHQMHLQLELAEETKRREHAEHVAAYANGELNEITGTDLDT